jgi:hypothetical protein
LRQLGSDALGLRALKSISNGRSRRNAKLGHHGHRRVCKSRKTKANPLGSPPKPRAPALDDPAGSDASGEELQQYVQRNLSFGFAC